MSKYDPLYHWLARQSRKEITLTFNELEKILGFKLPSSASRYPAWWDNEEGAETRHVQCKAWFDAGFRVSRPDFLNRTVVFVKRSR